MPIKINELVIQVKVYESHTQVEHTESMPANFLLQSTDHQKLALARDVAKLLTEQEGR